MDRGTTTTRVNRIRKLDGIDKSCWTLYDASIGDTEISYLPRKAAPWTFSTAKA